jgi:hypothetical protein
LGAADGWREYNPVTNGEAGEQDSAFDLIPCMTGAGFAAQNF